MGIEINLSVLLPGSLSKVTYKHGVFFHLTWKENQKTITRYIRLGEVKRVMKGIKAYQQAKKTIDQAAQENLKDLLKARSSK
jgi:hypothetical protein